MEAIFATYGDDEKENCILNLEPFMDRDPPVVCRTETLSRTYHQLRTMGYHHMFVMDTRPTVVGMITRKDLLEDTTKLKLAEKVLRVLLGFLLQGQCWIGAGKHFPAQYPPPPCNSYALVIATVGVGTVLIWYLILIRYKCSAAA